MHLTYLLLVSILASLVAGCSSRYSHDASSPVESGETGVSSLLLSVNGDGWIAARDIYNEFRFKNEVVIFEDAISRIGVGPNPMIGNIHAWVFSEQDSDRVQVLYVAIVTNSRGDRVLDRAHWNYKP